MLNVVRSGLCNGNTGHLVLIRDNIYVSRENVFFARAVQAFYAAADTILVKDIT